MVGLTYKEELSNFQLYLHVFFDEKAFELIEILIKNLWFYRRFRIFQKVIHPSPKEFKSWFDLQLSMKPYWKKVFKLLHNKRILGQRTCRKWKNSTWLKRYEYFVVLLNIR